MANRNKIGLGNSVTIGCSAQAQAQGSAGDGGSRARRARREGLRLLPGGHLRDGLPAAPRVVRRLRGCARGLPRGGVAGPDLRDDNPRSSGGGEGFRGLLQAAPALLGNGLRRALSGVEVQPELRAALPQLAQEVVCAVIHEPIVDPFDTVDRVAPPFRARALRHHLAERRLFSHVLRAHVFRRRDGLADLRVSVGDGSMRGEQMMSVAATISEAFRGPLRLQLWCFVVVCFASLTCLSLSSRRISASLSSDSRSCEDITLIGTGVNPGPAAPWLPPLSWEPCGWLSCRFPSGCRDAEEEAGAAEEEAAAPPAGLLTHAFVELRRLESAACFARARAASSAAISADSGRMSGSCESSVFWACASLRAGRTGRVARRDA